MMRRIAFLALLVSLPVVSWACMNDRDSDALAVQNKRVPDAIRVISGRFERNPPRYYQMRIARVERELKAKPRQFGLYDDLAVAHDRLGDDKTAMQIMELKRALLPAYDATDKANKEAWYRYFANDGTFRAHRFLHEVGRIGQMKQAREEIKRAIQIKPNAHFGRERVQLMVMDWIVARKQKTTTRTLGNWIELRDGWQIDFGEGPTETYQKGVLVETDPGRKGDSPKQAAVKERHRRDTAEGLAGLVVLGAAWNSPDVFEALAHAMEVKDTVTLRYMALLRCRELLKNKNPSLAGLTVADVDGELVDSDEMSMSGVGINGPNQKTLDSLYPQLRKEADQWNEGRARWMEARFEQGQHPDTETNFWQGFQEAAPPTLDVPWLNQREQKRQAITSSIMYTVAFLGSVLLFSVGLAIAIMKFSKRRKAKTSPV